MLLWCWVALALSFAACAWPLPMPWFFAWRCISGIGGAILMVLGPSVALAATPLQRRAAQGPRMFCGKAS